MSTFLKHSHYLLFIVSTFFVISTFANTQAIKLTPTEKKFETLEKSFDGKIGVYAIDTNNNRIISYHADEYFPVQSTSKLMAVATLLKQSEKLKNLLDQKVTYTQKDLMIYSPVTTLHVNDGLSFQALSEAVMTYSDNAAANLITKKLGRPKVVTDFAHAIGNPSFNMEHYEGELNSNPNNHEDSSTPKDMAVSLQKITLGDALMPSKRA
ncbi:MAG: serine hydrolase [Legionellales bacterium]|nr:serine hydrolase [Legionellales bacterium]